MLLTSPALHGFVRNGLWSLALQDTSSELSPPVEASARLHEGVQRRRILPPRDDEQLDVPFEFDVGDRAHHGAGRHRHVFGRKHDAETRAHEIVQALSAMTRPIGAAVG